MFDTQLNIQQKILQIKKRILIFWTKRKIYPNKFTRTNQIYDLSEALHGYLNKMTYFNPSNAEASFFQGSKMKKKKENYLNPAMLVLIG